LIGVASVFVVFLVYFGPVVVVLGVVIAVIGRVLVGDKLVFKEMEDSGI